MGLQRIIKASSGAQLSPSKIKLKLGDREEDITLDDARNAYIANPLAYKDTKDKELTEKALQIALDGLRNGTIQGTPGVDSLGNFTISGSADIFNLSRDPEQKELFKRVNQVVGNIAMQRYNSYKAHEVKEEKKEGYDYDTRAKTRGLQYSFFRNNADAAYQLNHLTGKYQSGKAYNGAMYDTEDKRMAQVDKYFRDIYDNEVLNKDFDSSRFGYNKDEFSKLYGEYNMEGLTPEQKREKAASLAMILGEGSNYSKIFSPLEYLQQATTEGSAGSVGYGVEGETPKQEYTDLGNGMVSTTMDGKTFIGTKSGDKFSPVTQEGTYGGYVVGNDGSLVKSKIPEINDFYSAAEFSKNPYLVFNGKKLNVDSPEYTSLFGDKDAKTWINDNKASIYGDMMPSDELLKQEAEQLELFRNKQYFNKPIQDLESTVLAEKADRKLSLVNSKNNPANSINNLLDNSVKQNVYDISDYFADDENSYFFTYKVNKAGKKERVIIKGKRDGDKLINAEPVPLTAEVLSKLPFAKERGGFSKREYTLDEETRSKGGFAGLWDMDTKRKPVTGVKVLKKQLGGNLTKQTDPKSINVQNPAKEDRAELSQKKEGTRFSDAFDSNNTAYDNYMLTAGVLDLASVITSLLPSTGVTNGLTAATGIGGTFTRGLAEYNYTDKSLGSILWDGAKGVGLDLLTAAPVVGVLGSAAKVKKAASFYQKFLAPGQVLASGFNAAQHGSLQKLFTDPTNFTMEDATNLLGVVSGLKKVAVGRTMNNVFKRTEKGNIDLEVDVKGTSKKVSLTPDQVKSIKGADDQVKAFKGIVAKQTKAKPEDINFNNTVKDTKSLQAKFWKGRKDGEALNFDLDSPTKTGYGYDDYNKLSRWSKFVARDQFQTGTGFLGRKPGQSFLSSNLNKPIPQQQAPTQQAQAPASKPAQTTRPVEETQDTAEVFSKGGVLKHQLGGATSFNSIFSKGKSMFNSMNSFNMDKPINKFGNKSWVTNDVFVTRPEYASPGELPDLEISPFMKQENPLDRFNKPLEEPIVRFDFSVDGLHRPTPSKSTTESKNNISYADVLDFTNLMYANKQTNNLKQYTNYKPALTKAPKLVTPSVAINGIEESNARRRIAELNAAKPQYASAEQTLMGKYAANAQGNEMSRQIGQSISGQLEQKKEAYRQAVNQQSMINADVANKNAASVAGNHNMQLNAQGELAKTIFQNNSNYLTRMAQNQRMKDTQREGVLNQKRALEHNYDPVRMQAIQAARLEVENARLAAKDDINDPVYRQAQMKLDSLIRMNELETEAIRNGVIL